MINKWIFQQQNNEQLQKIKQLAEELNISPVLSQLLVQRGITTFDEARDFFRPDLSQLHDPFLMAIS